jgi:predicted nuclease with RNAse H fold
VHETYVGIDVGGRRKGFHAAALAGGDLAALGRCTTVVDAAAFVRRYDPCVIGIDSPMTTAPPGATLRECERVLAREVCGIRWTPERAKLDGNPYYEWIVHGLELYAALDDYETVEVFPTAAWTVWAGPRNGESRARWSSRALAARNLGGVPPRRLSQDDRDAIAAALTVAGPTRRFGEIAVPR